MEKHLHRVGHETLFPALLRSPRSVSRQRLTHVRPRLDRPPEHPRHTDRPLLCRRQRERHTGHPIQLRMGPLTGHCHEFPDVRRRERCELLDGIDAEVVELGLTGPTDPPDFPDRNIGEGLAPDVLVAEIGHAGRPALGVFVRQLGQRLRRPDPDARRNLGDPPDAIPNPATVVQGRFPWEQFDA